MASLWKPDCFAKLRRTDGCCWRCRLHREREVADRVGEDLPEPQGGPCLAQADEAAAHLEPAAEDIDLGAAASEALLPTETHSEAKPGASCNYSLSRPH